MTVTVFLSSTTFHDGTSPDLALLNVCRLLARLEHNLLSPGADLKPLRRSEYQRMRVNANIEYARSLLVQLEQSLPQIKAPDRRHDVQTEIIKRRQTLKRVVDALDEISAEAESRRNVAKREDPSRLQPVPMAAGKYTGRVHADDEEEEMWSDEEDEVEDLLAMPEGDISSEVGQEGPSAGTAGLQSQAMEIGMETETESGQEKLTPPSTATPTTTTATTSVSSDHDHEQPIEPTTTTLPTPQGSVTIPPPTTAAQTSSVLRNRHALLSSAPQNLSAPPTTAATTTSSNTTTNTAKLHSTEQTLSTHRLEQEDLTASLLTMASQLKASTQAFHTTLEGEKSTLARAAEGLDRTTSSMQAAERRMGMLRRMTEGKGWWGRMMLYAWIFGLWVLAVLIVFLGPKLRF